MNADSNETELDPRAFAMTRATNRRAVLSA
jgi:hypothetical protein